MSKVTYVLMTDKLLSDLPLVRTSLCFLPNPLASASSFWANSQLMCFGKSLLLLFGFKGLWNTYRWFSPETRTSKKFTKLWFPRAEAADAKSQKVLLLCAKILRWPINPWMTNLLTRSEGCGRGLWRFYRTGFDPGVREPWGRSVAARSLWSWVAPDRPRHKLRSQLPSCRWWWQRASSEYCTEVSWL